MLPRGIPSRMAAIALLVGVGALAGTLRPGALATASLPACGGFGLISPGPIGSVDRLEARVGCRFERLRWYQDWSTPFDLDRAREIAARGAEPQLSWQPMVRTADGRVRGVPYREIARGEHDQYLREFARGLRRLGRPVAIAFAPEMNGDWIPYRLTATNRAEDFVAAYRRIHKLLRDAGARVRWVWTPNVIYPNQTAAFAELYPGDAYVDALGLDGYNWGRTRPYTRWQSFDEVFGPSLAALSALARKPVEIVEFSSADAGGDKARWIADMCRSIRRYPRLERLDWFNVDNSATERVDWRVDSAPGAVEAFAACTRDRALRRD